MSVEHNPEYIASLNYYCRQGLSGHVKEQCSNYASKFADEPLLVFFSGVAYLLEDEESQSQKLFESLQQFEEYRYASLVALQYIYKVVIPGGKTTMPEIENRLKNEKKDLKSKALYLACMAYFYTENYEKAHEFSEKFSKSDTSIEQLVLKSWVDIMRRDVKRVAQLIENAKAKDQDRKYDVDIGLLKAKFNELRNNFQLALDDLNYCLHDYPNFLPLCIEKMKIQLVLKQWDHCAETAERCLLIDVNCVQAAIYVALYATCFEGQYNESVNLLTELLEILNKSESANYRMYCTVARLFSRVCGRHDGIGQAIKTFAERSINISKSLKARPFSELAYHFRLNGQYKQSIKYYKQAMQLSDSLPDILLDLIYCQIMDGDVKEAENQLELFKAVHTNAQQNSCIELEYIEVLLTQFRNDAAPADVRFKSIIALRNHFDSVAKLSFGLEFLVQLNPIFLIEIIRTLFRYASVEPSKSTALTDHTLKEIKEFLTQVLNSVPGCVEGLYLLGKAQYLSGETDGALNTLQQCLNKDQGYLDAHLLLAQIYLQKQQFNLASQSLELALSFNFEVRDHPVYNLIKAKIQKKSKRILESIGLLENAIKLPKFKREISNTTGVQSNNIKVEMTESDRIAIYLELIDSYQAMGRSEDSTKLMQTALAEFNGKNEEQYLILLNADLALNRGDEDRALAILKNVSSDQPNYLEARQKMADIYLRYKKDKRQFVTCFRDIVEKNPSPQAFVMLGDAYMSIQEPEKAIELYESALKKNPKDHALSSKIGRALIKCHNYAKALSYYETALKTGQMNFLRYELADLLLKLGNFDKCERVLKQGIENLPRSNLDIQSAIDEVKFLMLLSKLYFETGNWEVAIDHLLRSKESQSKILERGSFELGSNFEEQKTLAADICCQLGQFYQTKRDLHKSISFYQEALKEMPDDAKLMMNVAYLYVLMGNFDNAHQMCQDVIKIDPGNDMATLMLADLMYQRNDRDAALSHFQQLLDRNPNQYHALARTIELAWRSGDIKQAEQYLEKASEASLRAALDGGYNYCKGLIEWYTGDPNSALQHFNRAKRDLEWGERSIYNIIEICLNPDNEIIGGEALDSGEGVDTNISADKQEAREVGMQTAENFLKELSSKPGLDYKYRLVENYILLATNRKQNIEKAVNDLMAMDSSSESAENVNAGIVLGLARAYLMLKQSPKAKAQLKRVLHKSWSFEEADYLEQCWLLLANFYINQQKFDVATDILNTCLIHNASCTRAMEFLGLIREKEQKWLDAALIYEKAWNFCNMKNPKIGYKLAMNYLKSKRYVDAIDTCHIVLKCCPNYPKIRKDILDKARSNLRM